MGVEQVTGFDGPVSGAGWRVFVSHTSELAEFPAGMSYIGAVKAAISACGHVIVDMAEFPAADQPPAELCIGRVRSCDVYVGVLGIRYGSPVRDQPEVSYTELEFDTATEAGLDRLVFLLDTGRRRRGYPAVGINGSRVRGAAGGLPPPGPGQRAGHGDVHRPGHARAGGGTLAAGTGRAAPAPSRQRPAAGAGPGGRGGR